MQKDSESSVIVTRNSSSKPGIDVEANISKDIMFTLPQPPRVTGGKRLQKKRTQDCYGKSLPTLKRLLHCRDGGTHTHSQFLVRNVQENVGPESDLILHHPAVYSLCVKTH